MKKVFVLFAFIAIFAGCSKDEGKDTSKYPDLLIAYKWQISSKFINPKYNGTNDGLSDWTDKDRDNWLIFKPNGEYWIDEGLLRDAGKARLYKMGTWSLIGDVLKFNYVDGANAEVRIEELTNSKMVSKFTFAEATTEYTVTDTYIAGKLDTDYQPVTIASINFEKPTLGAGQVVIFSVTISNPETFKYTISWSSGSNNFGNGYELELTMLSAGEKTLTATVTDELGRKSELTKTFTVVECDFGFGMWGDKLDVIQRSETGVYKGNNMSTIYHWLGSGWDRYYTFSDNKLSFGMKVYEYTPKTNQNQQIVIAWTLHEEYVSELTEKFGAPTEYATYVRVFTGDPLNDALALINGGVVEIKFSNSRTNVTYTATRKPSTANTVQYEIRYSQKN